MHVCTGVHITPSFLFGGKGLERRDTPQQAVSTLRSCVLASKCHPSTKRKQGPLEKQLVRAWAESRKSLKHLTMLGSRKVQRISGLAGETCSAQEDGQSTGKSEMLTMVGYLQPQTNKNQRAVHIVWLKYVLK